MIKTNYERLHVTTGGEIDSLCSQLISVKAAVDAIELDALCTEMPHAGIFPGRTFIILTWFSTIKPFLFPGCQNMSLFF